MAKPNNKNKPNQPVVVAGKQPKATFQCVKKNEDGSETTITYGVMINRLIFNKKEYSAQDIAENVELRDQLLNIAWEERDEVEFEKNGIFKIIY